MSTFGGCFSLLSSLMVPCIVYIHIHIHNTYSYSLTLSSILFSIKYHYDLSLSLMGDSLSPCLSLCACVYICVYACTRERERERVCVCGTYWLARRCHQKNRCPYHTHLSITDSQMYLGWVIIIRVIIIRGLLPELLLFGVIGYYRQGLTRVIRSPYNASVYIYGYQGYHKNEYKYS